MDQKVVVQGGMAAGDDSESESSEESASEASPAKTQGNDAAPTSPVVLDDSDDEVIEVFQKIEKKQEPVVQEQAQNVSEPPNISNDLSTTTSTKMKEGLGP